MGAIAPLIMEVIDRRNRRKELILNIPEMTLRRTVIHDETSMTGAHWHYLIVSGAGGSHARLHMQRNTEDLQSPNYANSWIDQKWSEDTHSQRHYSFMGPAPCRSPERPNISSNTVFVPCRAQLVSLSLLRRPV